MSRGIGLHLLWAASASIKVMNLRIPQTKILWQSALEDPYLTFPFYPHHIPAPGSIPWEHIQYDTILPPRREALNCTVQYCMQYPDLRLCRRLYRVGIKCQTGSFYFYTPTFVFSIGMWSYFSMLLRFRILIITFILIIDYFCTFRWRLYYFYVLCTDYNTVTYSINYFLKHKKIGCD